LKFEQEGETVGLDIRGLIYLVEMQRERFGLSVVCKSLIIRKKMKIGTVNGYYKSQLNLTGLVCHAQQWPTPPSYSSLHVTLPLSFLDHVFELNIGLRLLNNHCMD
jgi:hypothetical protein